jgi:uncharacterized membrane protein
MTPVIQAILLALHLLVTVVLIGQQVIFALVVLPVLGSLLNTKTRAEAVARMAGRNRPLVLGSLLVFVVTGMFLLVGNPYYMGFMDFSNT